MVAQVRAKKSISGPTGNSRTPHILRIGRWTGKMAMRHWHAAIAILVCLFIFTWLITYGEWQPFTYGQLTYYYDSLADSLLHGHMDVAPDAISFEAFIRDGKYYGYFGFTPALFRIPLSVFPWLWGRWSCLSMMAACLLSLLVAYRLITELAASLPADIPRNVIKTFQLLYLLAAGCGSSLIFLASRSFVYHEATIWGGALALTSGYALFLYARQGSGKLLAVAGTLAFLAFFARPTTGAGATLAMLGISSLQAGRWASGRASPRLASFLIRVADAWGTPKVAHAGKHAVIALGCVLVTTACSIGTNYLKFHTWESTPLEIYYYYWFHPELLRVTEGKQLHVENIPTTTLAYFGRIGIEFRRKFPWITPRPAHLFHNARIADSYWCSSVPASMPALLLLAGCGTMVLFRGRSDNARRLRLPTFTLACGGAIVLCSVGICERYVHDFYPAAVFAAAAGVDSLIRLIRRPNLRRGLLSLLALLVVAGTMIEFAFSLEYQREFCWGTPPIKRAEYQAWQKEF